MGNTTSHQKTVDPPEEWEPESNNERFELVSPMSDLSDPSMFLHRHPVSKTTTRPSTNTTEPPETALKTELGMVNGDVGVTPVRTKHRKHPSATNNARQTPAGDRRRKSKVITKGITTRDSSYQHESRQRDMPPPSSFYFPSAAGKRGNNNDDQAHHRLSTTRQLGEDKENQPTNTFQKARCCMTACIGDTAYKIQLEKDNAQLRSKYAKEGQRLSSQIATKDSGKEMKRQSNDTAQENDFEPFKQKDNVPKTKATAWQFVDGSEKKLSFDPVWRESQEGAVNEESRRSSVPTKSRASSNSNTESRRASVPSKQGERRSVHIDKDVGNGKTRRSSATNDTDAWRTANAQGRDSMSGLLSENESAVVANKNLLPAQAPCNSGNNDESCISSKATSHESSYWGAFYEDAQVLHQEDQYFDSLAYKPTSATQVESSPMADQPVATPVATLFERATSKSLLGPLDFDEHASPSQVGGSNDEESINRLYNDDGSLASNPEEVGISLAPSADGSTTIDGQSSASTVSTKRSSPSRDIEAKTKTSKSVFQNFRHSSLSSNKSGLTSEGDVSVATRPSEESTKTVETPVTNKYNPDHLSLVETEVTKNSRSRMSHEETPQTVAVSTRESFGSAYSYRDKDVFTPVTASTTYRKGSPFRPLIGVQGKAMAKAKMDQPLMFTQSMDNTSRASSDLVVRATESAPSVIEHRDYRDIAFGSYLQETPTAVAAREKALKHSPAMSVDSSATTPSPNSPSNDPVSEQAMDNAAFLFSPSYAGSSSLLLSGKPSAGTQLLQAPRPNPHRDSLHSISTLGSRSRSSVPSARSQKISVPKSSSFNVVALDPQDKRTSTGSSVTSVKSVRFADDAADEKATVETKPHVTWDLGSTHVEIPAIETKISDLTDVVYSKGETSTSAHRTSIESVLSKATAPTIEEETLSEAAPETPSRDETTPEQTASWKYCELTKGVTPMLHKTTMAQAANSPVLRFKAARGKFNANKTDKVTPVKKSQQRKVAGNFVNSRIAVFDNGGAPLQPTAVVARCFSKDSRSVASSTCGSTTSGSVSTMSSAHFVIKGKRSSSLIPIVPCAPSDEEEDDQSCESSIVCESSVATLVREDRIRPTVRFSDANVIENYAPQPREETMSEVDADDKSDDILSDLLCEDNYETDTEEEEDTVATVPQTKETAMQSESLFGRPSIRSIVSADDEDESSTMTDIFAIARSFSEESTAMSSYLANTKPANLRFDCAPVKVNEQAQHQHTEPGSLFLSPTQRTPMQAQKWRQLADAAKKNDRKKLFRSKNQAASGKKGRSGKGLSERNTNVVRLDI